MCPPRKDKKSAFTLAEVLITLGIIGVVAAMTLPSLIGNYQKTQTVNQLKKIYSELNQAIRMAESEYGTMDSWDFTDFPTANARNEYFGENYLFKNIKVVQKCVPTSAKCWKDPVSIDGVPYRGGAYINATAPGKATFVTASGYSVHYWVHGTGDGGWFWVDINGPKRGNSVVGKDVFPFGFSWGLRANSIYRPGFYPVGLKYTENHPTRDDLMNGTMPELPEFVCKKGTGQTSAGGFCGAVIMLDGWQIKDDYPW